jgi:DDE_Tnp_1-associated
MGKLKKYFRRLRDPRAANASYPLLEILFVALAAVLCGAKSCTDMSGHSKPCPSLNGLVIIIVPVVVPRWRVMPEMKPYAWAEVHGCAGTTVPWPIALDRRRHAAEKTADQVRSCVRGAERAESERTTTYIQLQTPGSFLDTS